METDDQKLAERRKRWLVNMSEFQKIIAVVTLLAGGIYALIGWNLKISYDALERSNEAIRVAEASRPNPYTSIDATDDMKIHQEQHVREIQTSKEQMEVQIQLVNAEHLREIERLPRPPPYWVNRIDGLASKVKELEIDRVRNNRQADERTK